jgi:hypothetical protein
MANRHCNKKLRAEIRARRAITGESHQTALSRILALRGKADVHRGDAVPELIATSYFGVSITIAAYEILSHVSLVLVSGTGGPMGLPWSRPLPIHVHADGVQ